ncbi:MAG: hypothetical protein V3W06_09130 [Acidimicrobiia bacterium]
MVAAKNHDWILSTKTGSEDVHMLWETEIDMHDLDNGLHCVCAPSLVKLATPTHDPDGKLIYAAIRHRPAVERAYVPEHMPEKIT